MHKQPQQLKEETHSELNDEEMNEQLSRAAY
jgi:hypothetical protein